MSESTKTTTEPRWQRDPLSTEDLRWPGTVDNMVWVHVDVAHDAADEIDFRRAEAERLGAEVEALRRWKAEATEVIEAWEAVHEALGSPAALGESKAAASRARVVDLREANARQAEAIQGFIAEFGPAPRSDP